MSQNRKIYGWARTKEYPSGRHPARYKKVQNNNIIYHTFTHSKNPISINGVIYEPIELSKNINPIERGDKDNKSHVVPVNFKGERSSLGNEVTDYKLFKDDKEKINNLSPSWPTIDIPYTTNSKKHKKSK